MKQTDKARSHKARGAEPNADDDTTLHLRLGKEDRERMRSILGFMIQDPEIDRRERVSYAGAVRYAMRRCVENPPAHVKPEGQG
jgi:hypothetical protein